MDVRTRSGTTASTRHRSRAAAQLSFRRDFHGDQFSEPAGRPTRSSETATATTRVGSRASRAGDLPSRSGRRRLVCGRGPGTGRAAGAAVDPAWPGVLIDAWPSNAGRSALLGASAASVLCSQPSVLLDDSRSTLNHRRRRRCR